MLEGAVEVHYPPQDVVCSPVFPEETVVHPQMEGVDQILQLDFPDELKLVVYHLIHSVEVLI